MQPTTPSHQKLKSYNTWSIDESLVYGHSTSLEVDSTSILAVLRILRLMFSLFFFWAVTDILRSNYINFSWFFMKLIMNLFEVELVFFSGMFKSRYVFMLTFGLDVVHSFTNVNHEMKPWRALCLLWGFGKVSAGNLLQSEQWLAGAFDFPLSYFSSKSLAKCLASKSVGWQCCKIYLRWL